ncbi:MAG: hypothetical protein R2821_01580 [Flavobacteriaceae bacterium]
MSINDDIKLYLPKYLSEESTKKLLKEISDFPKNLSKSLYTSNLKNEKIIFQGDGIRDVYISNLPSSKIGQSSVIIFSNTCDIDFKNERLFPSQIFYAPIFNLNKYSLGLINKGIMTEDSLENHLVDIKKQRITQILYLPPMRI